MNLVLRPLHDVNDVTWSIIWCLVILLAGVLYVIVYILGTDEREANAAKESSSVSDSCSDGDAINHHDSND